MKLTEAKIIEQRVAYNQLVESICKGMDTSQRKTILEAKASARNINRVLREAQLSTAQINALFGAVEQNATASGSNRTAVGKGKDVVDAVNNIINQTGRWIQNTTPVQGFDAKFEQLKGAVGAKFPELDKQLTGLGDWAKENPGKTAAIIGVLTVLGGIAGGPVGGAIAGQALRGSMELIKGEKLSTAIGKGAKTAAMGFLAGKAFEAIGDVFGDFVKDVKYGDIGEFSEERDLFYSHYGSAHIGRGSVYRDWVFDTNKLSGILTPDQQTEITGYLNSIKKVASDSIGDSTVSSKQAMEDIRGIINKLGRLTAEYTKENIANNPGIEEYLKTGADGLLDSIEQWTDVTSASVQGAVTGAVSKDKEAGTGPGSPATQGDEEAIKKAAEENDVEGVAVKSTESVEMSKDNSTGNPVLSESDIFKLFTAVAYKQPLVESQYVDEAPIGDMIKKAGSAVAGAAKSAAGAAGDAIKKGASAVAQQAATVGKNITTKVTVDKLMKAWEKAGSPNNDEKVAEFLTGFGIDPRSVQAAFKTAKLAVPKDAPMDQVEVIVSQAKQNSKLKDAIMAYLEGPTKRTPDTGLGQQPQTATA